MSEENLLELAADIVSAHVGNNPVSVEQLPTLIKAVYGSLASLGKAPEPEEEKRQPAVSIRSSIKPDTIVCLDCGAKLRMLKRHLMSDHGLSVADYRARWNLPADYPMVTPQYSAARKELAKKIGLGRKPGQKAAKADQAKASGAPRRKKAASAPAAEG
ncbi:MAG: MucR family transcriptional regulator [Sphingomonadales bacterium]|nr:MucR family transcriptional regulator [Sphingomonadales bacterium]